MAKAIRTFSLIIPTYQRRQELCQCLNSLVSYFDPEARLTHGITLEVIVTDDARDPQLSTFLREHYPWCLYTAGPGCGPAANRNHGAHQSSADWLVFTDDDCLPQQGWIEAFAQYTDHCDVMEGKTSAADIRTRIDQECPINETGGYLWSCNFAIRRELFLQLGGFNEQFPAATMEDVELNQRINKSGLRRQFLPAAHVKHPWRSRKGRSFLSAKAQSIATYVGLHPETEPAFSLPTQLLNLLRALKGTFGICYVTGTVQGLPRQVALDIYATFCNWRAVKRARIETKC